MELQHSDIYLTTETATIAMEKKNSGQKDVYIHDTKNEMNWMQESIFTFNFKEKYWESDHMGDLRQK